MNWQKSIQLQNLSILYSGIVVARMYFPLACESVQLLTRCWRKDWTSWELNGAVDMFEELSDKDLECALNSPRWQITRHSQSSLFAASQSVNAGLRWLSSQK